MPDNYSQWEAHEARQEAWLNKRPICCHCGQPIQEETLFCIFGSTYHCDCANDMFLEPTEEHMR